MKFCLIAATALLLSVSGSALAQATLVEIDDATMVTQFNQNADTVDDWDVYNTAGVEIGEVEDVLGTDRNTPTALGVDLDGKEGYADRDVAIPLDQFTWQNDRLVLNASPEAVAAIPAWDD